MESEIGLWAKCRCQQAPVGSGEGAYPCLLQLLDTALIPAQPLPSGSQQWPV